MATKKLSRSKSTRNPKTPKQRKRAAVAGDSLEAATKRWRRGIDALIREVKRDVRRAVQEAGRKPPVKRPAKRSARH